MITVKEAIQLVLKETETTKKTKKILVANALNYVLSEDVFSPINMPPFRQSSMDGYAINAHTEKTYKIVNEVKAGDGHLCSLKPGEAIRIFTGAAVPDTANTVIIQEHVTVADKTLTYEKEVKLKDNIRKIGEQIQKGDLALKKNTKLNAAAIGFLSTLGITEIQVYKKPTIAILVTGNELIQPGEMLTHGKIYESNSVMLKSALQSLDYNQVTVHKISDVYEDTKNTIEKIINTSDLVLVSGGISVGDYDFVGKALKEVEVAQVFYKVRQKPGKPLFFGKKGNTTIFALPGNPASAMSCFYIYVSLALEIISGNNAASHNTLQLTATTDFIKKGDRAQFLKAFATHNEVAVLEGQNSAMLHTFALANALVYIDQDTSGIKKGDLVTVYKLPN